MKKSYAGFVLWVVAFVAALLCVCSVPAADFNLPLRLIMLLAAWGMASLTFIVWRTEQVYWYNGVTFEEAVQAGPERRKAFAWKHLRIFGLFALGMTAVSCATWLLGWSAWIDFVVCMAGVMAAVIRTTKFRL